MLPPKPPPSPKGRGIGRILLVLLLLLVSVFSYWRLNLYFRVKSRIAAVHSAGLPTSGAELNEWLPPISDSENGALVLMEAFTNLIELTDNKSNRVSDLPYLKGKEIWSPIQRALAERYVATNRQALAQIETALREYSKFQYPVDYSYGAGAKLPHLRKIKMTAQILRIQSALQAQDRDPSWTNSVLLQLKLAETLEGELSLVGCFVRIATIQIAARAAEYALNHADADPTACRVLEDAFLHAARTKTLPTALIAERAMFLPYFRMSRADVQQFRTDDAEDPDSKSEQTPQPSGKGLPVFWFTGFFERDLDFYLATMEKGIPISKLPAPENLQLTNVFNVGDITRHNLYIMSGMFLPALAKTSVKAATGEAAAKLAATSFAIESFRHANNRPPEKLQDLVPTFIDTVPIDPFDGKPIRYRTTPRGYILYSVDADGHDDNGTVRPARRKPKDPTTYDFNFTIEQ